MLNLHDNFIYESLKCAFIVWINRRSIQYVTLYIRMRAAKRKRKKNNFFSSFHIFFFFFFPLLTLFLLIRSCMTFHVVFQIESTRCSIVACRSLRASANGDRIYLCLSVFLFITFYLILRLSYNRIIDEHFWQLNSW